MNNIITIFRFEIKHALKTSSVWLYGIILFLFSFLIANLIGGAFDQIQVSLVGENTEINSPAVISKIYSILSIIGLIVVAILSSKIPLKDFEYNSFSQSFTLPITKTEYILGKYFSAICLVTAVYCMVTLGYYFGTLMPYLNQRIIGPFKFVNYFYPFVNKTFINAIVHTSIFFSLGLFFRNNFITWIGIVFTYAIFYVAIKLSNEYNNQTLSVMLDPFGLTGSLSSSIGKSSAQLNSENSNMGTLLIANRIVWLIIGFSLVFIATWKFKFIYKLQLKSTKKTQKESKAAQQEEKAMPAQPYLPQNNGSISTLQQLTFLTFYELKLLFRDFYFRVVLLIGFFLVVFASKSIGQIYGTETFPVSYEVSNLLSAALSLFTFIIIVVFSGEMIWKERQNQSYLVNDALPVSNGVKLVSKINAMLLLIFIMYLTLIPIGIITQNIKSFTYIELSVYLKNLIGVSYVDFVLLVLFSFTVQVFSKNKYIGYFIMMFYFIWSSFLEESLIQHKLLILNSSPEMNYSDLNGFGYKVVSFILLKLYWLLFALILLLLANKFYPRGTEINIAKRLKNLKDGFKNKKFRLTFYSLNAIFILFGTILFYNFNILNTFQRSFTEEEIEAQHELKYNKYLNKIQPQICAVNIKSEIYPKTGSFSAHVSYTLKNISSKKIEEIYLDYNFSNIDSIRLSATSSLIIDDKNCGFKTYQLKEPLIPGDSIQAEFTLFDAIKGFGDNNQSSLVDKNGTFINSDIFPKIGYNTAREIKNNSSRRKHKLTELAGSALKANDPAGLSRNIFGEKSLIRFELIAGTDNDQTIVAPGELIKSWSQNNRNYFQYQTIRPINNFYSILSANYVVEETTWFRDSLKNDKIKLAVYHHSGHPYNTQTMLESMKESLAYYEANFSPFQYKSLKIVEFPNYSRYAQSFSGTIPFSESIGFLADLRNVNIDSATIFNDNEININYPFYVTAHETAHQWWGHQITSADVEGNTFLIETLSQYSALMVMKQHYGEEKMKKFLSMETFSYLSSRNKSTNEERPLITVLPEQQEIYYRKGSVIMYALQDYLGESNVNTILHAFLEKYGFKNAPYPTAQDLITEFEKITPDSLKYIITDWFKSITIYNNKPTDAMYVKTNGLEYQVTFTCDVHKFIYDEKGNEKEKAINDYIEIGVYNSKNKEIYLKKIKFKTGKNNVTLTLGRKPQTIVIDPYNKLIDKNWLLKKLEVVKKEKV